MSIYTRNQEFINSKKILNLLNNHKDKLKKDEEHNDPALLNTLYKKQGRNKGYYSAVYKLQKNEKGRQTCKTGYAALSRKVRHYLASGIYFDIDMKNSIYSIMSSYAKNHGLKTDAINNYINNREEVLAEVMKSDNIDRDEAKKKFTQLWFVYNKCFIINAFQTELRREVRNIQKHIINNQDLTYIKTLYKGDEPNIIGKYISQFYFTLEWDILEKAMNYCKSKNYEVCADLHDGFFIKIDSSNQDFEESLKVDLNELNNHIMEKTQLKAEFIIKPMTDTLEITENQSNETNETELNQYLKLKEKFEKKVGKIQNIAKFVVDDLVDNNYTIKAKQDLQTLFEDFHPTERFQLYTEKPATFLKTWFADPDKRIYRKLDFIPDVDKCPEDIYNIFKGFDIANFDSTFDEEITDYDKKDFQLILDHIKFLCDDGTEESEPMNQYVLNWLAHLFQKPTDKATTSLIIKGYEGCGKGILYSLIRKMLGKNYGYTTADPMNELFGSFNSCSSNKMLVNIDEIDKKQASNIYENLKKYITEETLIYKEKFVSNQEVSSYARVIITTNNDQTLQISDSNRRFVLIECKHKKKPALDTIDAMLNNDKARLLFYRFLMERDITNFNLEKFPQSAITKRALQNSSKDIVDFLDSITDMTFDKIRGNDTIKMQSFYTLYQSWCRESNVFCKKKKDFKADLLGCGNVFKEERTANNRYVCWDDDDLKEYLKANGYSVNDFIPDTDDESEFD
jgi:hypothetical protein